QEQMEDIVAKVQRRIESKYPDSNRGDAVADTWGDYKYVPATDEGRSRILDCMNKYCMNLIGRARGLGTAATRFGADPETKIGPELEKALKEKHGYDIADLRKMKELQFFTYGYVWR